MIKTLTREEIERLIRLDLIEVRATTTGQLEARVYDKIAENRVPVEVWRTNFDPSRLSYLVRRAEKATIEMGWSVPQSLLARVGYIRAAHEAAHWEWIQR
jgi:hypothetical protein